MITATYDSTLSRVQLDAGLVLNTNPYFETDAAGWESAGGTFVRSTAQAHTGVASGLLTPDGVAAEPLTAITLATSPAVTVGEVFEFAVWVRCATARNITAAIQWFTSANVLVSFVANTVAVAAGTWTKLTVTGTVPATAGKARIYVSMPGTPAGTATLHIDDAELYPTKVLVERSTNQVTWKAVRGGNLATVVTGTLKLNDYEFAADVVNYYRARGQTTSITPMLDGVWLKSITRPFLNKKIGKHGIVDNRITRAPRQGLFYVKGRTAPIAVTDVRGGKEFSLRVITTTQNEYNALDYVLASGDILFVHSPPTSRVPTVYVSAGEVDAQYHGVTRTATWLVGMTEVQAPGAEVVGTTVTWGTIIADFATWNDVLLFFSTWASVLEYVADPSQVIVA